MHTTYSASLDPDGNFEFRFEAGLATSLGIHSPGRSNPLRLNADLNIEPGLHTWSFGLETAQLEGHLDPPASNVPGSLGPRYSVQEDGVTIRVTVGVDEQGHFGPVLVPAGRGELRGPKGRNSVEPPLWAELELDAGEVRVLDLR